MLIRKSPCVYTVMPKKRKENPDLHLVLCCHFPFFFLRLERQPTAPQSAACRSRPPALSQRDTPPLPPSFLAPQICSQTKVTSRKKLTQIGSDGFLLVFPRIFFFPVPPLIKSFTTLPRCFSYLSSFISIDGANFFFSQWKVDI